MSEITIDGKLDIEIKPSDLGFVGVVKELPIVVESPTEQQLETDVKNALATHFLHSPKALNQLISVKITA